MKHFAPFALCVVTALPASAQTVSDAALEECQVDESNFTSVNDCLPHTEAAMRLLNAVTSEEFYGDAGSAIIDGCAAANEKSPARWACVSGAINDAVELAKRVGSPEKIKDRRFLGVSDGDSLQRLERLEKDVFETFGMDIWDTFQGYYRLK